MLYLLKTSSDLQMLLAEVTHLVKRFITKNPSFTTLNYMKYVINDPSQHMGLCVKNTVLIIKCTTY
jgi:hypothetical protein